jgi:flagellum-specific ATP synthase
MNKERLFSQISEIPLHTLSGKVTQSIGLLLEAKLPGAKIGSRCKILFSQKQNSIEAEIVGFRKDIALLMPYDEAIGISQDSIALLMESSASVKIGSFLLGRVIDAKANPIDGKEDFFLNETTRFSHQNLYAEPSHPLNRALIDAPLDLGVKALNGLLTIAKGQRIGIMAGSGVGKSMLLGMISRFTQADINVIALVGERGREVGEFIARDLGPEVMKKSIVIVATSDKSALLRTRAAYLATAIAEYFRDQKKDVLLMMDSVTRFCMAQREIGLSAGEPPASKGYTPGVFAAIPKLLERAGTGAQGGSITGIYTVLVDGDDLDEPIADATRGILDGHIVLSRKLAQKGHYPAIDVLKSTSRVMHQVISNEHKKTSQQIKEWMAIYEQIEELIQIGAYIKGSQPKVDQAIAVHDKIEAFLRQEPQSQTSFDETLLQMQAILRHG